MTTELLCLVVNALWGAVLVFVEVLAKTKSAGVAWNAGNREREPDVAPWVQRTGRALSNHKENFPLFATGVLVVHLTGRADRWSALACIVYVVARVVHALLYMAGITRARSLAFGVGLVAVVVLYSRLLA